MTKYILFTFILLSLMAGISWGQGTIINDSFFSPALGMTRNVTLYLPEVYFIDTTTSYPVVYFLHGFGETNTSYSEMYPVLDSLMEDGTICPMIVVKPDGSSSPYIGSFYTNSELNGDYEDYIVDDLVAYIDLNYRTLAEQRYRGISGHSMGGYGTMKLAMKHSDKFSSLTCHSGPIKFDRFPDLIPDILAERNPGEPLQPWNGPLTLMFFAMSGAFTPNLSNPPFWVDLPLDTLGNIIDSIWTKWFDHDPYTMINNYIPALESLAIYFDCGDQDELLLFPHSVEFSDTLTALGILHTFVPYAGGHSDSLVTRIDDSFIFHSLNFCGLVGEEESSKFEVRISRYTLLQNTPNPFRTSTLIRYQIPSTSHPSPITNHVTLAVYDITGRLVETLIDESQESGVYRVQWAGKNEGGEEVPSGIYFYRLTTSYQSMVKKMVLLR